MADWLARRFGATVTWLPFDLHPEYPPSGLPRAELLARVGPQDRLAARFAEEGLAYSPNAEVVPRSLTALRLAELGREHGRHREVHDALMDAYWRDGVDLGDHDALRALDLGLPADEVEDVLATDRFADRVRASTAQAQSIGIDGIPAWVIDGRLLIPGAQPREVFERAFAQLEER